MMLVHPAKTRGVAGAYELIPDFNCRFLCALGGSVVKTQFSLTETTLLTPIFSMVTP